MGDQRLRPAVRRVPAPGRPRRRPPRTPACVHGRHRRLQHRLAAVRFAWSEGALIGARATQGLGAAIISPAALSILTTTFAEGPERNTALGAWGAVGAFGAVAGVLLGGILTDLLSWQWIFYINAPVGVIAFLLAPRLLDESRDVKARGFDLPGAGLVTGGLVTLVYGITQANKYGWGSAETFGSSPRRSSCSPASWSGRPGRATRSCRCRSSGCGRSSARTSRG